MSKDAGTIGEIAQEAKEEKEKRKSFTRLFTPVFDDLRNPCSKI